MRYFLKKIIGLVPLLLIISLLAFILVRLAPGGPFDRERKPASPEIERNLLAKYHLDKPIWMQYLYFLKGICHGDFGASLKYRNHAVTDIIVQSLPVSMCLGFLAFVFSYSVGIPAGIIAAARKGQILDWLIVIIATISLSVPGFVIGPFLILVFAIKLQWFPVALWESAWHAVLPTLALGIYFSGRIARLTREGLINVLNERFILAARARGVNDTMILVRHALPLGLIPVITYTGPVLADLLTGSFVVENVFQIPGIGVFLVNSCLNRDYPMIVGIVIVYSIILVSLNLLTDIIHWLVDPRIRHE